MSIGPSYERGSQLTISIVGADNLPCSAWWIGGENISETNRVQSHILQVISQAQSWRRVSLGAHRRVPTMTSDIEQRVSTKVNQLLTFGALKGSTPVTAATAAPTPEAI